MQTGYWVLVTNGCLIRYDIGFCINHENKAVMAWWIVILLLLNVLAYTTCVGHHFILPSKKEKTAGMTWVLPESEKGTSQKQYAAIYH